VTDRVPDLVRGRFGIAGGRREALCLAGYLLLLVSAYFIAKNTSAKLMVLGLVAIVASEPRLPHLWRSQPVRAGLAALAGIAACTAISLAANHVSFGSDAEVLTNFVLLALLVLAGARLISVLGLPLVCRLLLAVASASAAATLVLHFAAGFPLLERVTPLGRAANPIPGAGGLCTALLVAVALLRSEPRPRGRQAWLIILACLPILIVLLMTQSRGPLLAGALAIGAMIALPRLSGWRLFLIGLLAWAIVTGLVLLDPWIRGLLCHDASNFCRPSARIQIWGWVLDNLQRRPLFGLGPAYRFDDMVLRHPHNGVFGVAMFYGLPMLALLLVLAWLYSRLLTKRSGLLALFCAGAFVFSFGYMGSDLPNPFAFANMHYLFLWLPIAFGLAGEDQAGGVPGGAEVAETTAKVYVQRSEIPTS